MRQTSLFIVASIAFLVGAAHAGNCHIASYRLLDGRAIDFASAGDNALRWRMEDGNSGKFSRKDSRSTLGWSDRPDGHHVTLGTCESGEICFDGARGTRIPLVVTETRFTVAGAELAGRLLLPEGQRPVPIVVLVHGSEQTSARPN